MKLKKRLTKTSKKTTYERSLYASQVNSINQQNYLNQNFKAGKIILDKELQQKYPRMAGEIVTNLKATPTYQQFTEIFDAKFKMWSANDLGSLDYLIGFDVSYKKAAKAPEIS